MPSCALAASTCAAAAIRSGRRCSSADGSPGGMLGTVGSAGSAGRLNDDGACPISTAMASTSCARPTCSSVSAVLACSCCVRAAATSAAVATPAAKRCCVSCSDCASASATRRASTICASATCSCSTACASCACRLRRTPRSVAASARAASPLARTCNLTLPHRSGAQLNAAPALKSLPTVPAARCRVAPSVAVAVGHSAAPACCNAARACS
ncbi:hypothetical protein GALL_375330 [mine drainage metagenome]|uniref:Uncharacterized protein n=1 Tax=mine drainage metagenome TaxID=410659 RepID=A0A1J5QT96_9ZZZZ